jgi:hypothetical protein
MLITVKLTVPLLFVDFVPKATPALLYNVQVAPVVGALYTPKTTVMALRRFSIRILLLLRLTYLGQKLKPLDIFGKALLMLTSKAPRLV